jgi:hypothetical protein
MLNKILWKHKNKWQIFGAALGTFIGMFLLLQSVQLYSDLQNLMDGTANSREDGYLMINKKVSLLNTLGGASTFSQDDISTLKKQNFIAAVGEFKSNQFKVSASSQLLGFYSEMFMEAVPDQFMDVKPRGWNWSAGDEEVPLVISRDYLALYNFGFAPSQGYPQFTQSTIKQVSFTITTNGNGIVKRYRGRIAGFSDRINSILVPQSFLDYANANFGNGKADAPSRLILSTDNPYSENLNNFLAENNYEISRGRVIGEQLKVLLQLLLSVVGVIGVIIVLLSFLVFILNFQLVIAESSQDIELLLQIGHRYKTISQTLIKNLSLLFGTAVLVTFIALFATRFFFINWTTEQGFSLANNFSSLTYLVAVLFVVLFFGVSWWSVNRRVVKLGSS